MVMKMKPATATTLLLNLTIFFILTLTATSQGSITFKCNTTSSCDSLIDYIPPNSTTLSQIANLFDVKNLRSLLGANSLPLNTSSNQPVSAKAKIKIPFPCMCINGTGISNERPVYTVKKGDGLDFIARTIFAALVTYPQIAAVNNIPNVDKIEVGQQFWIPLPCSCNQVNGSSVVHYGYVVETGNTVGLIAEKYGTTEATLLSINGISDPSKLQAGAVLDVPLRACSSKISNTSLDYPLLVPNGTYTFTANNCVKCKCDSSNNWILNCEPSPKDQVKIANWSQCPLMQCQTSGQTSKNVTLGLMGDSSDPLCERNVCSYTGYTKQTISTAIVNEANCRVGGGGETGPSPRNSVSKIGSQGSRCWWIVISLTLSSLLSGLLM